MSRILIWYRNDLRLHDHQPLQSALSSGAEVVLFYCFDPRQWRPTSYGFPKTGIFRTQFLLESVQNLRESLQNLGSDLILRQSKPEVAIPAIVEELGISAVYFHQEVTSEETTIEQAVQTALKPLGTEFHAFWGHTLYDPAALPFAIEQLPELFTDFRKQVESRATVSVPLPAPSRFPALPRVDRGSLPELADFGLSPLPSDPRAVLQFQGGERAGLARLDHYFWKQNGLKVYKETRNGLLGADYSSKFSPWLALGCLSPRYIYHQVQQYETQRLRNDSTYWMCFELLWRDYFRWIAAKHGDRIFRLEGLQGIPLPWRQDWQQFHCWQAGKTGFPLIDANLRELAATGFMSNRGRQNVASFLTKNLGIDWRMGAAWFESMLIDYDVCSNWGNWNYTAGVGNDARGFRYFNILKQSQDYDPQGDYVKHWLPELAGVPVSKVHEPWKLLPVEQQRFGVKLGRDYPEPIVDLNRSVQENEQAYQAAIARVSKRHRFRPRN